MSKLLLAMLRRFLTLGVEGDDDDAPTGSAEDANVHDEGTGDEGLDDMLDAIEPEPKPAKRIEPTAAEERAMRIAAEQRAEAAERRASEYRPAKPSPATDPETEREDAQLAAARAAGQTAEQLSWLEWQVAQNRRARTTERTANGALQEARDISDKTNFDRLETTKPGIYKKYADRVEKAYADEKAQGRTVPRSVILRLMVGDDLMNGKIKAKAKPAAEGAAAPGKVDRGRMPSARTDVNGKTVATNERDKRRERLRGVQI